MNSGQPDITNNYILKHNLCLFTEIIHSGSCRCWGIHIYLFYPGHFCGDSEDYIQKDTDPRRNVWALSYWSLQKCQPLKPNILSLIYKFLKFQGEQHVSDINTLIEYAFIVQFKDYCHTRPYLNFLEKNMAGLSLQDRAMKWHYYQYGTNQPSIN